TRDEARQWAKGGDEKLVSRERERRASDELPREARQLALGAGLVESLVGVCRYRFHFRRGHRISLSCWARDDAAAALRHHAFRAGCCITSARRLPCSISPPPDAAALASHRARASSRSLSPTNARRPADRD